ncbi:MAG: pyroglutamyl-peptidase I [Chitinophagaceae bacterium]|nr:pyroglutamyl-peptidase I [Polaromonas sp.]
MPRNPSFNRFAEPSSTCVLLTGFDPFGGDRINPSWLAVHALHGEVIAGCRVTAAQLPTVFAQSLSTLDALLEQHRPALVVCVGQAGGRDALSLERVAINVCDARMVDNGGAQPVDVPVVPGGPAAYFSSLPIKAMLRALQQAGLPAEVSQTAGTFVCNQVFYGLMHSLAHLPTGGRGKNVTRGGFIHVPYLAEQGTPCMPLSDIVQGLRVGVACALATPHDVSLGAGQLS